MLGPRAVGKGLALALLVASAPAAAQELVTDRPDFTESALAVPRSRFQLEGGATASKGGSDEAWSFGELLLRIGLSERVELRLEPGSYAEADGPGGELSGWEDAAAGLKVELSAGGEGGRPDIALIAGLSLPTGEQGVGSDEPHPEVVLAVAWDLTPRLGLGANLGLGETDDGERDFLEGRASVAMGFDLGGHWGGFLEAFALYPESGSGEEAHFVDAGLTWLATEDLQLDLRAGQGLDADEETFVGAGFAVRW
ncbi:MAG: transporter [Thermoanaerobaculia bacterium]